MSNKYSDIIDMEHPVSKKHPKMSLHDRSAQFAPFAALTGHSDAIDETAAEHLEEVLKSEANDIFYD